MPGIKQRQFQFLRTFLLDVDIFMGVVNRLIVPKQSQGQILHLDAPESRTTRQQAGSCSPAAVDAWSRLLPSSIDARALELSSPPSEALQPPAPDA